MTQQTLTFEDSGGGCLGSFRILNDGPGYRTGVDVWVDDGELELTLEQAAQLRDWLIAVLAP